MKRAAYGQPKRQGGISLVPALWEKIDEAARLAGVPRNQIMERALMERFGMVEESRNSGRNSRLAEELELELA